MGRLAEAQAVIAGLFDSSVAVAVTDPGVPQPPALADEAAHLDRAIPKRQREFAAGRAAARTALMQLGLPPQPIPAGADRAPIWPQGWTGSISHSDTLCAAAVTREGAFVGLDIEPDVDLSENLLSAICTPQEIAQTEGPDQLALAKLIFSAKEAAFKAQFPVTRKTFGFDHMAVCLDQPTGCFVARFTRDVAPFGVGHSLEGRFDRVQGHIATAVHLPQGVPQGG